MLTALVQNLHRSEEGRLRRFFFGRLHCREDAADATQETFLRLLTVPAHSRIEHPQAYLFRVARAVAYASVARKRTDGEVLDYAALFEDVVDDMPGPERIVDARQRLLRFAKVIEDLPPRCRQVFVLSRLNGLPNGEIATRLGISRNMVEKHVIRALLACRAAREELF